MKSSFRILTVFGINVELHFSFILLFVLFLPFFGLAGAFFLSIVFFFVLAHELAHSLVAKRSGIPVEKIVLTFIGGVANLEIPENPRLELYMAAAGPALNIVVAVASFSLITFLGLPSVDYVSIVTPENFNFNATHILHTVMYANLLLALFNMIPGFPMDGGRVLRSLLALRMDYIKATELAVSTGQQLIFPLFFIFGLLTGNFFMVIIAFVLFVSSGSELKLIKLKRAFKGLSVREISEGVVPTLRGEEIVHDFLFGLKRDSPRHHIVYGDGGRVLGVLDINNLAGLSMIEKRKSIGFFVDTKYRVVEADNSFADSVKEIVGSEFVLIVSEKKVVGYLTPQSLSNAYIYRQLKE